MFMIGDFFLQTINWPSPPSHQKKKKKKNPLGYFKLCLLLLLIFLVYNWGFQLKKSSSHTQPGCKKKN